MKNITVRFLKKEGISGKQKDRVIYKDVLIIAITKYVTTG
jgi:hypothetical protein